MPQNTLVTLGFVRNSFKDLPSSTEVAKENIGIINTSMDRYRENQKLALMEAAEHLGIPFSKISNQMAGIDPSLAIKLASEDRNSMEWNREESEAEFKQYREEMARKLFSAVLQRGIRDVKEGLYDNSQLAGYCNQAASYIAAFDAELAERLLRFAEDKLSSDLDRKVRLANLNKEKDIKDANLLDSARTLTTALGQINPDTHAALFNKINLLLEAHNLITIRKNLLKTKYGINIPIDKNDPLLLYSGAKPLNKDGLRNYALGFDDSLYDTKFRMTNEIGMDVENNRDVVTKPSTDIVNDVLQEVEQAKLNTSNSAIKSKELVIEPKEVNNDEKTESLLGRIRNTDLFKKSSYGEGNNIKTGEIEVFLKQIEKLESFSEQKSALESLQRQLANAKARIGKTSGEATAFDAYDKQIEDKLKFVKELEKLNVPVESTKVLAKGLDSIQTRNAISQWKKFSQIANEENLYGNAGTIINYINRILLPEERQTDSDVTRTVASAIASATNSNIDNVLAAFSTANGGNSFIQTFLKGDTYSKAVVSMLPGLQRIFQTNYENAIKNSNEETVDNALRSIGFNETGLKILKGEMVFPTTYKSYEKVKKIYDKKNAKKDLENYRQGKILGMRENTESSYREIQTDVSLEDF